MPAKLADRLEDPGSSAALRRMPASRSHAVKVLAYVALTVIVPVLLATAVGKALEFARILNDPKAAANKDFVSYWAASKLLLAHRNPYDSRAAEQIERTAGYSPPKPVTMRNPPLALPLVLPLGWMSIQSAAVFWLLLILGAIVAAVYAVWRLEGCPPTKTHLLGFVFPAALCCLGAGQLSAFALIGVTGFLCFHKTRPMLAGFAIAVCLIKPHLFFPFGAVLFCWMIVNKNAKVLLGSLSTVASCLLVLEQFRLPLWSAYRNMLQSDNVDRDLIASAASALRLAISPDTMWLQFAPALCATAWAVWYYWRRRANWNWLTDGSLLLVVSLLVAPYAWFFDEIVILPAVLLGIHASPNRSRAVIGFGLIAALAAGELLVGAPIYSGAYLWTSAAWLGWYVFETRATTFRVLPKAVDSSAPA